MKVQNNNNIERIINSIYFYGTVIIALLSPICITYIIRTIAEDIQEEPQVIEYKEHTFLKFKKGTLHDPECKKCLEKYD